MKHRFIYFTLLSVSLLITSACKKNTVGFLSPYIHYEVDPILIPKGRNFLSAGLNGDGTSQPYTCKVLHFYNKATGQNVDTMFAHTYPVPIWTALYNPKTDTTIALINAKRSTVHVPAIAISPESGQITANFGALNIPGGEYQFDLQITNTAGTKIYPKIGDFILKDTTTFDAVPAIGATSETRILVGNESISKVGKPPHLMIMRVADTPNIITVKYADKNGVFWNPKNGEVVNRPAAGLNPNPPFLQSLRTFTHSFYYTPTSSVFAFPFTPFPLNQGPQAYNIYQRIPTQFVINDGFPNGMYSLNLRFPIRIYVPGSYLVIEQSLDATHAP